MLIFRTINLHPICLPKWNVYDIEGKPTNTKLYKSIQWENYQRLYSLKALHKDIRFSNVWTDVNGPSKFLVQCTLDLVTLFYVADEILWYFLAKVVRFAKSLF